jgi:amino acid adenylation domain-containing protein
LGPSYGKKVSNDDYKGEQQKRIMNIANLLWDTARNRAHATAVLERDSFADYAELHRRAAGFGCALQAAGVRADDRVAIFLDRGADAAAAFFGSAAAGGIAVVVNETLRSRQIEYILEHCGASVLVSSREMLSRLPRKPNIAAKILDVWEMPRGGELWPVPRELDDAAQIIYTSGSTGSPKGVSLSHGNLRAAALSITSYLGIRESDRIASFLPFSYVYGFGQLMCAVSTGASLVIDHSPLPQQLVATLRISGVTVLPAVPPLWLQLLATPDFRERPIESLRVLTNAGGRLAPDAVRRLRAAQPHAQLFLMYGSTETIRSTYLPPEQVDAHPDSIGRPIPGAQILVLREDMSECDTGEVGVLAQRGPTVALGYWNDPAATARVFRPSPLRVHAQGAAASGRVAFTGDLVRRDADGFLYYVGRNDSMIKTLGYRVSPDEVADALYASGEVLEAVVLPEADEVYGQRIVAYVVLLKGGSLERLKMFCGIELPRHLQPARFEVRAALPRNASGKHDPGALRRHEGPRIR